MYMKPINSGERNFRFSIINNRFQHVFGIRVSYIALMPGGSAMYRLQDVSFISCLEWNSSVNSPRTVQ